MESKQCEICNKSFPSTYSFYKHIQSHRTVREGDLRRKKFHCIVCDKSFFKEKYYERHFKRVHKFIVCEKCGAHIEYEALQSHDCEDDSEESDSNGETNNINIPESFKKENIDGNPSEVMTKDCFKRTMLEKKFLIKKILDPIQALSTYRSKIKTILKDLLSHHRMLKFFLTIKVTFLKHANENESQIVETGFFSGTYTLYRENEIEKHYDSAAGKILSGFDEFVKNGSGFTLQKVVDINLRTAKYSPIPGCSYIKTPMSIANKKAIVNIRNKDNKCFELSCLAELHKQELKEKYHNKRYKPQIYSQWIGKTLNMEGISEPMRMEDLEIFERKNDLGINVFSVNQNGDDLRQTYAASLKDKKIINLLRIDADKKSHFTLITDLNRLFNKNKKVKYKHYCNVCLQSFDTRGKNFKISLEEHKRYCTSNQNQKTKIPTNRWIEHKNFEYECKSPVVCYCDFECIAETYENKDPSKNNGKSCTTLDKIHTLCGYSFYIASEAMNIPSTNKCFSYCGKDAGRHFLQSLDREIKTVTNYMSKHEFKYPILSKEEEDEFQNSEFCHLCKAKFKSDELKVRNHDHITSKYLGSAHNACNLSFRKSRKIPCFMHNFSGYDSHLLIKELAQNNLYLKPIAKSLEKFISFSYQNIQFKDSYRFIPNSLNELCKDLKAKTGENYVKFPATYRYFKERYSYLPDENFEMLTRKLPFPYDYLDSFARLEETSIPTKSSFDNKLTGESITDDDYLFVQHLWHVFQLKNLKDLTILYNEIDTLLLCDIFTEYRTFCYNLYSLEAARFITAPSLAWAAAIKLSNSKLEIPDDMKMHKMIDSGLRGGISLVRHPFTRANHPELEELFNPKKPQVFLAYTDFTNLYGAVMQESLPTHNFVFSRDINGRPEDKIEFGQEVAAYSNEEWENKIIGLKDDDEIGFLFEVSLSYDKELHDIHNELPFCAENIAITQSMLSDYQNSLAEKFGQKRNHITSKLTLTLSDKNNYVCHYRVLKQALKHGLKLKEKPHVILQFNQSPFLKKYILLHQDLRIKTESPLIRAFCKNQNNVVFGKSCQNTKNYKDIYLTTNKNKAMKLINSPRLNSWKIYSPSFASFQLDRKEVLLDRPRIVGMSILEISKTFLYHYFYDYVLPKFPGTKVILTDTDSFCLAIPTEQNFYDEIKNDTETFDFSNLPSDHRCYNNSKKMISGLMKDELKGELLYEVVALRSKMYSMITMKQISIKRAKGVLRKIISNQIQHTDYLNSLFQTEKYYHSGFTIFHKNHNLFTANVNKVSLSPYNDKLFISKTENNEFQCYSFGHYKIQSHNENNMHEN